MSILPPSRPRASRDLVYSLALAKWKSEGNSGDLPENFIAVVPGYYWRTMGDPNKNDRGIYDDAFFIFGKETFAAFNGNADPSVYRKGISTLLPGVHWYRKGNHGISRPGGGYPAFRPATAGVRLPVRRDGEEGRSKRDGVANNIHRGGWRGTSSEGCLTIPPNQWDAFYALQVSEMSKAKQPRFPVIIFDEGAIT